MRQNNLLFTIIFFFMCFISCKREEDIIKNSDGVIVRQPYLWASSLSKDNILSNNIGVNVIYDNKALTMGVEKKNGKILGNNFPLMKNIEDGKDIWKWNDRITDFESEEISFVYQNNQFMTFSIGPRNYGIDLSTGQTLWKKEDMNQYDLRVLGLGNSYFVTANADKISNFAQYGLYEGDIRTGKQQFIVFPIYQNTYKGSGQSNNVFRYAHVGMPFLKGTDTLLSIVYQETVVPSTITYTFTDRVQCFLSLYNKTQKNWVYDRVLFTEPDISEVLDGIPVLENGFIYHSINKTIFCHEVLTGKQVWTQTFDANFLFSGFIKVGNKILANNEGTYLYALDAQTGKRLWQVKSPGTCTRMQELNDVVYFVGGGDGLLYAVDADNGKVYWKIASPDKSKNSGAFFYNMCSVAPGVNGKKGRVIVSSGLNAFCYEAVR